jgi:branched-chain amino acid transport system substrate-binding protein
MQKTWQIERRTLLAGLAGTLGLAWGGNAGFGAGQPIRVGGTLSLTGPLAQTALVCKIVSEIYVEDLNARGGLLGRPVEFILLDDQSKPDVTRSLYEKLITVDKVDLIMGPYGTSSILAAMGVAQRYSKLIIQSSMGIPKLATYDMQFPATPFGPQPDQDFPKMVFDALDTSAHPPKTVSILTSKFPSAQVWTQGAKAEAERRGLKVPLYLEYEFGNRDFGAIAARVKDANADFLWVGVLGLEGNQLMEALKKLDYTPPRQFYLFPAPGPFVGSPDMNHALSFTVFEEQAPFIDKPGVAHFVAVYKERAAKAGITYAHVDNQASGPYCAWQILEAAVIATKSLDDKAMGAWLRKNPVDTIDGTLSFDGPFNHGPQHMALKQIQDGKFVVVWPNSVATPGTKLIAP